MAMGYGGGFLYLNKDVLTTGAGALTGVTQQTVLLSMDAKGQLGPSLIPQLGGFGTPAGVAALATGIPTFGLGLLGALGKTKLRNHKDLQGFLLGYGGSVIFEQLISALLNTSAVQTPAHMAAARALPPRAGSSPGAAAAPAQVPSGGTAI